MRRLLENQKVATRRKNRHWPFFPAGVFLVISLSWFLVSAPSSEQAGSEMSVDPGLSARGPAQEASPQGADSEHPAVRLVQGKIKPRQTFYDLMIENGSSPREVQRMAKAARGVYNLRKLLPGKSYELAFDGEGDLFHIKYRVDPENTFVIQTAPDRYEAYMENRPLDIYTRRVQGVIRSSLFEAVQAIGEGPELAVKLAEIFAWDIDFHFDIREGDRFVILFEEQWRDGRFYGYGRILAAEFENGGETLTAVYHQRSDGAGGYYTPEGTSLQKQFLRSPLKFTRISSGFTYKRFHPILKRYRPHLGVDYVAPVGTPVHAAGDGKVIFAGRKGGNGNFVKIRHNRIYMTGYLHLSRIARGIRSGRRVTQGQVIGYVGKTGLATGPHLCYRFYRYGKFVNPLTVKFPSASPVPSKELTAFARERDRLLARLLTPSPVYLVDRDDYLIAGNRNI